MSSSLRRKSGLAMIVILLASAFSLILSATVFSAERKGNETKGRVYFRDTCKTCHIKGAAGGEITPMSKTIAQWKTYFEKAKHNQGTEPLTKVMSAEKILDVSTYLGRHAADSLQPETCGK
jgi:hypothetical protein